MAICCHYYVYFKSYYVLAFFSRFLSCVRYGLDAVLLFFFSSSCVLNTLTLYSMHGYWVNHMPSNRFSLINMQYDSTKISVWAFSRDANYFLWYWMPMLLACEWMNEWMNEMLDMIMHLFNVQACSIKCASAVSTFRTVLL